ncbi:MAG: sigma 54-interacting transcriptional regulator [candidate division WOR-3 bacterium]
MTSSASKIGRYKIIAKIEEGNYTTVYRVKDKGTEFILKIARKNIPEFNQLIIREFQILSQFNHPNIVRAYEYNTTGDGTAYFTLEYVRGKPINESFRGFSPEFVEAIIQVVNGLGVFHNRGFIHGDLKPEHIIYNPEEKKSVLIDFGFAGITTHQIRKYGTMGYVAPEVLKGIGMDQRSDLYSLGVIVYEILSGRDAKLPIKPIKKIPEQLNNAILRLLSEEPVLRPTAPELYEILTGLLPEKKIPIPAYEVHLPPTGFVEIPEIMEKLSKLKSETVIISGEVGLGKTRLLKELRYKYLFKGYDVFSFTGREEGYLHEFICNSIKFKDLKFAEKEDRFQIYAEITERLIEFAKDRNVVILVDNLDELNDYEIGLFRFIGHSLQDTNVIMIATSNFDPRIKDLNFLELSLRHFSVEEVKTLIEKTFFAIESKDGGDFFPFIEWLHRHTGGNPLFIVETLQTVYNQKILNYYPNRWQIDTKALKEFKISENIEEILSAKLRGLNEAELNILKILCIADYPLECSILCAMIPEFTGISLEVLKVLGLIKEENNRGKRFYSPANQILKMLVAEKIAGEETVSIIKNIIKAIEDTQLDENLHPLLSRLYCQIDKKEKAYHYLLRCAEGAERINNQKEAIEYYTNALKYSSNSEDYLRILLKLGELYLLSGDNHRAIEYYNRYLQSKELEDDAFLGMGKAYSNLGEYKEAIRNLRAALERTTEDIKRIEVLNRLAYCLACIKDFTEGERILKESIKICRKLNNPGMEADTRYYYATLEWFKGEYEKGKRICLELLDFCSKNKLDKQAAYTANLLSSLYIQTGDIEDGLRYIDKAIAGFERIRNINALVSGMNNKAFLLSSRDEIRNGKNLFEHSLQLSMKIGNKSRQFIALSSLGDIYEQESKFDTAIEFYQKAIDIEPDSIYANYGLAMVYYKISEIDKAKTILEERIAKKEEVLYLIGIGLVYSILGRLEQAKGYIEKGIDRLKKENLEVSIQHEAYLKSSQFYYEIEEFAKALQLAERARKLAISGSREFRIADSLVKINQFRLNLIDELDIESHIRYLKDREFLYDYALLKKLKIESIIEKGIESEKIREIAEELESVEKVFAAIGAELEHQRVQKLQLNFYPTILRDYTRRIISVQYLETFSKLAELISSNLGDEGFITNLLDLVIEATEAERGAIFIKTEKGMEFVAGRNIDKKTIKDAGELSKTAIEEINKNRIVFVPNALEDPKFNIRKSVLLNQIRSILCIPLEVGNIVVGAIYLDSRTIGSIFTEQDRDFLITISKIIASVIEKSIAFRNLTQENILLKSKVISEVGTGYLIGKSGRMKKIYEIIDAIAQSDAPVLITGETGTGKGMLARLIHLKSKRRNNKFLSINCGAIPETLLESELFGHKKGAFTGAYTDKKGLLEEGEGGTIFLDEISNTGPGFQAKILEAIEEKTIRRVGETIIRKIDVRFILATNKELEIEVEEGRFRQDLYYRINVFKLNVPPLRERVADIPELANFFLNKYCREMGKNIKGFAPGVIEQLKNYHWPGNIRELMNVIERAVTLCKSDLITLEDIGLARTKMEILPLKEITKEAIIEALNATGWNKKRAAERLGISRKTLYNLLKRYSIFH